jgi:hypothetical protein
MLQLQREQQMDLVLAVLALLHCWKSCLVRDWRVRASGSSLWVIIQTRPSHSQVMRNCNINSNRRKRKRMTTVLVLI